MSGGFTPGLVETTDPLSGWINVLASEHGMNKSTGITIDRTLIPETTVNGKKVRIVKNGTVLAQVTATRKYGPYDETATDGREEPATAGVLVNGGVNVENGDTVTGILIHGSVLRARLTGWTPALEAAISGRIIAQ
ncbi:capsid decoration protein [Arthrobacter phage DanielleIgnace]|nr:capsid decoration protein [Arthrobacter phage DanielleIgnace]